MSNISASLFARLEPFSSSQSLQPYARPDLDPGRIAQKSAYSIRVPFSALRESARWTSDTSSVLQPWARPTNDSYSGRC